MSDEIKAGPATVVFHLQADAHAGPKPVVVENHTGGSGVPEVGVENRCQMLSAQSGKIAPKGN